MSEDLERVRQAVAVFDDRAKLGLARGEIEKSGPDGLAITLLGNRNCFEGLAPLAEIGSVKTPMAIYSSEGTLAEVFRLAGAGPGVEVQPILKSLIPAKQAAFLEERLRAGETLLWVSIHDAEHEAAVCRALLKHSPYRVQVHDLKVHPRAERH